MVRKILDGISVASFAMSLTIIVGGGYIYLKRAEFVNDMIFTVQDQLIRNIQSQIQIPSIPNKTGPTLPFNR